MGWLNGHMHQTMSATNAILDAHEKDLTAQQVGAPPLAKEHAQRATAPAMFPTRRTALPRV